MAPSRGPKLDKAELKSQAKRAKADLDRACETPVPRGDTPRGQRPSDVEPSIFGDWKSDKGECRIFVDHITHRMSYEECFGDCDDRLHGWLEPREGEKDSYQAELMILEDGICPWYGPSYGEKPEVVGDIRVRLVHG